MTVYGGNIILASDLNALETLINTLNAATIDKPVGRLRQGTAQTGITNTTATAATFTATDEIDTAGIHDPAVNPSRGTPNKAGYYLIQGSICLTGQTDYTVIQAYIAKNGAAAAPATRITPSASSQTLLIPASAILEFNGTTDYFEIYLIATRSGGGTSSTAVSSQFACTLEWQYLRPA